MANSGQNLTRYFFSSPAWCSTHALVTLIQMSWLNKKEVPFRKLPVTLMSLSPPLPIKPNHLSHLILHFKQTSIRENPQRYFK